jgi:hypothetical protein
MVLLPGLDIPDPENTPADPEPEPTNDWPDSPDWGDGDDGGPPDYGDPPTYEAPPPPYNITELLKDIRGWLGNFAKAANVPDGPLLNWWESGAKDQLYSHLGSIIATDRDWDAYVGDGPGGRGPTGDSDTLQNFGGLYVNGKINPYTIQGSQLIESAALGWMDRQLPGFGQFVANRFSGSGSGRGRSSGSRKPTAGEIRAQFDEAELTDAVTGMGQAYLVEELDDAGVWAKAYIEEHVRTGGEKKIDFETFVKDRMKKTARWQMIYRNKPQGVDELEYMKPYTQAALSAMGGASGNVSHVSGVVAGGAALGSSEAAFMSRLKRTDQVRNSSGFISGLEDRLQNVSGILRG